MPRFYSAQALQAYLHTQGHAPPELVLDAAAARHVQVLRMQPGHALTLFDGLGGEYAAQVCHMGRSEVRVQVLGHSAVEREASRAVHLALGVPANERMDYLVEKATELGVARITPLMTERGVLRLSGERADKKRQHWQQVAAAASEQCGRNRVPQIDAAIDIKTWLGQQTVLQMALQTNADASSATKGAPTCTPTAPTPPPNSPAPAQRYVLSLGPDATKAPSVAAFLAAQALENAPKGVLFLSGAEGGLSAAEEAAAVAAGFAPLSLGPRTLRAETAPLQALVLFT